MPVHNIEWMQAVSTIINYGDRDGKRVRLAFKEAELLLTINHSTESGQSFFTQKCRESLQQADLRYLHYKETARTESILFSPIGAVRDGLIASSLNRPSRNIIMREGKPILDEK